MLCRLESAAPLTRASLLSEKMFSNEEMGACIFDGAEYAFARKKVPGFCLTRDASPLLGLKITSALSG